MFVSTHCCVLLNILQIMCTNDDLKELGVTMGPRKKLMSYIKEQLERKRIVEVSDLPTTEI